MNQMPHVPSFITAAVIAVAQLDVTVTPFWINFYDWSSERYAQGIARILEDVPGVYDGRSGYSTGAHRGRLPFPKWTHPDWRGPGNEGEVIAY